MSSDYVRRLRMIAGPNGSGKTTLVRRLAREFSPSGIFQLRHFVNADDLFAKLQSQQGIDFREFELSVTRDQLVTALRAGGRVSTPHPFLDAAEVIDGKLTAPPATCDPYVAAAIGDVVREKLFALGKSFSFETVMSHRSKVDFLRRAQASDYRTYLYFIATDSPEVNAHRVETRIELGGHAVPKQKIWERYHRCLALVGDVVPHAVRAFFFDNSGAEPLWLAEQTPEGKLELKIAPDELPGWFQKWVAPHFGV